MVVTGAVASLLIVVGGRRKALAMAAAGIAGVTLLSGPVAYGLNTISTPHTGSLPTAGPRVSSGFGPGGGGAGGLLNASTPSAALVTTLQADAGTYDWIVATVGANSAAGYQLATGDPVMAIGGFNGSDPWPTLAVFEQYVANGNIHYFIAGGGQGGAGGTSSSTNVSSQITSWVESHYTATTVGGTTVYDLTVAAAS